MLSVIIPVYNAAAFLPRCLESLIGQTYQNLEVICVDDGSSDNSLEILQQYADRDSRIKVIHQENAGVSAARNAGLDVATGEYVTFVDADDWLELDAYEKVMAQMVEGVDMVWFGTQVDGEVSPEYRKVLECHLKVGKTGPLKLTSVNRAHMGGEIWNKIFRRNLIEQWKLRFPQGLAYGEDKAFSYAYALAASKCLFIAEKLYHYYMHSQSAMGRYDEQKNQGEMARLVFDLVHQFANLRGIRISQAYSVFALLYDEYLDCCLPGGDAATRQRLYREGTTLGVLKGCRTPAALALRHEFRPRWERFFHGYIQNREYFGIGKLRFWSVTYEFYRRVHRCLVFYICSIPNNK